MKSKEEIDELYHKYWDDFSSKYDDNLHYYSFVEGYTQCQEDMAVKIKEAYIQGLLEGYACMPSIEGMPLINSLNKQDL
jgi:hypothetical protein